MSPIPEVDCQPGERRAPPGREDSRIAVTGIAKLRRFRMNLSVCTVTAMGAAGYSFSVQVYALTHEPVAGRNQTLSMTLERWAG